MDAAVDASMRDAATAMDSRADAAPDASVAVDAAKPVVKCVGDAYCAEDLWLCRPDLSNDYCDEAQTVTVWAADGTQSTKTLPKASNPKVDCFYVYPTVALSDPAGNVEDFDNLEDILVPLRMQAVPFSSLCRVFAPLYHQITLYSYLSFDKEKYMEVAYQDVLAAWKAYLTHWNDGRDIVLLGHSQGSHMLRRLIQREVETNDALRERIVVALAIGATGEITVPVGKTVGGTFAKMPLCTTREERGCVLAYDSATVSGAGFSFAQQDVACVSPGFAERSTFTRSLFPTLQYAGQFGMGQAPDLPTSFVELDDAYTGKCARGATGSMQLQVAFTPPTGATVKSPIDLASANMHVLDYTFPLGDLLDVTQAKIAAP